jgi:hypothetical protein
MKIDPAMCMKTQETVTKCPVKNTAFTRECTNCTLIDDNLAGLLAENAHRLHEKSGRTRTQNRRIGSSAHRRSTGLVLNGAMARPVTSDEQERRKNSGKRQSPRSEVIGNSDE